MITNLEKTIAELIKQNIYLNARVNVLFALLSDAVAAKKGWKPEDVDRKFSELCQYEALNVVDESPLLSDDEKSRQICDAYGL